MASKVLLTLTHNRSANDMDNLLNKNQPGHTAMNNLINVLQGISCGAESGKLDVYIGAVSASQTFTCGTVVATNNAVINGQAITAVASGAVNNQFNVGASPTESATNLAAAINASTTATINTFVSATSSGAVVTVFAQVPGTEGNVITTTSSANITAGGATLTGGSEGTKKTYNYGIA